MDRIYQGSALRRARMLARKSIKSAAEALGVTEGAISQWELGLSSPSIQALEQLASFYDMPMDTMLDRPGAPMTAFEWYSRRETPADDSVRRPWGDIGRRKRAIAGGEDSPGPITSRSPWFSASRELVQASTP